MKRPPRSREKAPATTKPEEGHVSLIRLKAILAFLIAASGILLYSNTLNHGFVLDDNSAIENNWLVKKGTEAIPELFRTSYRHGFWVGVDELYRPLPLSVFAAVWEYFPGDPKPFHLINILLYGITCGLLFITLARLFEAYGLLIPLIASLLFTFHPVHTEVVANIKSMDEILSLLFILISILCFLSWSSLRGLIYLILGTASFFCALLSKESAITFVAIIPLALYFLRSESIKGMAIATSCLVIPTVAFLLIREQVVVKFTDQSTFSYIDNVLYYAPDIFVQFATAMKLLGLYLLKSFLPVSLASDYTFATTELTGWGDPFVWMSLVIHLLIAAIIISGIKRKAVWSFGLLFYLVSMSIFSNLIIVIGSPFGERFLFTPIIGICLSVAALMTIPFRGKEETPRKSGSLGSFFLQHRLHLIPAMVICVIMSFKTIARNSDWESSFTLYEADVRTHPECARLHYFYANELRKVKALRLEDPEVRERFLHKSIEEYNEAIRIYPEYKAAIGALGVSYYRLGNKELAYEYYDRAIRMGTTDATTYNNMAVLFSETGNHRKALEYYERAVVYDPYYFDAWRNIGNTQYELGNNAASIEAFRKAIEYKNSDAMVNFWLATGLREAGQEEEAKFYFNRAFKLDP